MYEFMSDAELEQMYQEVILEASKDPHGKMSFAQDITSAQSELDLVATEGSTVRADSTVHADHVECAIGQSHQFNPTCGDEVTVRLELSDVDVTEAASPRIEKLVWDGQGCSISQASLSIMYDLIQGKTLDEALELSRIFHKLMQSRGNGLDDEQEKEMLDDAIVFQGVSRYPMRIKCALLGWEGFKDSAALALASHAH